MKFLYLYTAVILLFLNSLHAQKSIEKDDIFINEIQQITQRFYNGTPKNAVMIGIIKNGKEYILPLGNVDKDGRTQPDEIDLFELGSVSEVFTTTLLSQLAQEGLISTDDPASCFLPKKVKLPQYQPLVCTTHPSIFQHPHETVLMPTICYPEPNYHPKQILLCDLATHTSALPDMPAHRKFWDRNFPQNFSQKKLFRFINRQTLPYETGAQYSHSAVGISLLATCIEQVMEDDYENIVREKIFHPLGMNCTSTQISTYRNYQILDGHDIHGKITHYKPSNALAPAIGITTSMEDMMKFLKANLNLNYTPISTAFLEAQKPKLSILNNGRWEKIALGWHSAMENKPIEKQDVLWINGNSKGFYTYIALLKSTNSGVVILSNSNQQTDELGKNIIEYLQKVNSTLTPN